MAQGNVVGGWQSWASGLAVAACKPSVPDVAQTTQDPDCVGVMCGLKFGFFFILLNHVAWKFSQSVCT